MKSNLRFSWHVALAAVGTLMLAAWAFVWLLSLERNHLAGARHTWVPAYDFLGLDFLSSYFSTRHWLAGCDPYREPFGDPLGRPICYPPVILPLFAWVEAFSPRTAVVLWTAALAVLAGLGTVMALRTRGALGAASPPLPLALAAILCSTPVLFAMERGNWDLLVLLPLAVAALAMRKASRGADCLAGSCLALAASIKLYPALLVLALLASRRYRAACIWAVCGLALALTCIPDRHFILTNLHAVAVHNTPGAFIPTVHTLSAYWPLLCRSAGLNALGRIDGTVAALSLGLPVVLGVSWYCYRRRITASLAYPFMLWLAAAATFFPVTSNDYNLFYLPLAVLALWRVRDGVVVHVLCGVLLFWWQPMQLPIHAQYVFLFKLSGFCGVTLCLMNRAREAAGASLVQPARRDSIQSESLAAA